MKFDCINAQVRGICLNQESNKIVVGTFGSDLIELSIDIAKKTVGAPKVFV